MLSSTWLEGRRERVALMQVRKDGDDGKAPLEGGGPGSVGSRCRIWDWVGSEARRERTRDGKTTGSRAPLPLR